MAKADSFMQMVTFTMVTGKTIKRMVLVFIVIWMVLDILDNGRKINNMGKDLRPGQMVQVTRDNTLMVENTEEAVLLGQITAHIQEISLRTTLKVKVSCNIFN